MAKVTGPLMSFGASGQIGKGIVMGNWRGVKYARSYVKPANPQTNAQQANRALFAFMREMWKLAPSIVADAWNAFAAGRPFTGMNKWVGENVRVIGSATDLQDLIGSPGARGGLPPSAFAAVTGGGSGEINVTFTAPTPPAGWTIAKAQCFAVHDQDPHGIFDGVFIANEDSTSPYAITLTGLGSAKPCVVCGWLKWTKPDGSLAYSVSLLDTATSGA